ncbi:anti-sigma factor [Labrenzia sp. VG12]|uniref:anti-sigma factor family protein n=1 Tax=Labrenzia sp. VG12 TaxID=2021862 RepID=UPI000B8C6474|nr:zf-HC2 domain-containing protein [Labrenzia sp. VG12]ASP35703.1 hypothetical protein CHH27_22705 [Labrenzia sp. VG12]
MSFRVSDETLTAYLDGELAEDEQRRIEAALESDPALVERLEMLSVPVDAVREAFDTLLDQAPAYEAPKDEKRISGWAPRTAAAGLVAAGLLLGALWSPWQRPLPDTDWKMAVANYQVLYVPATLPGKTPEQEKAVEQLTALSADLGRNLSAAASVDGLNYRRAQMLGLDGNPLVQIAYLSGENDPVAICITRVDASAYGPKAEMLAGLASAHWIEDGYGFLVIGGEDLGAVKGIAEQLQGRI